MKKTMQVLAALLTLCALAYVASKSLDASKNGVSMAPSQALTYKIIVAKAQFEAEQKRNPKFQFATQEKADLIILEQRSASEIAFFSQFKKSEKGEADGHDGASKRELAMQEAVRVRMVAGDEKIIYKLVTDEPGFAAAKKGKSQFHFSKIMMNDWISYVEDNKAERDAEKTLEPNKTVKADSLSLSSVLAKVFEFSMNVKAGDPFPSFKYESNQGRSFSNGVFKDKLTVINFFFDKCAPCIHETSELNSFAKNNPQVQVMAMTFDKLEAVNKYVAAHHFEWPILPDADNLISEKIGIRNFPSFILVNGEGQILGIHGSFPDDMAEKGLSEWIEKMTQTKTPTAAL